MPSATADTLLQSPLSLKGTLPNPRLNFHRLVEDIRTTLGSENGITSSDDLRDVLQERLVKYRSEDAGWQEYGFQDLSQTFTRNLILKGSLTETRYAWPTTTGAGKAMSITEQTTFPRDQVTYMADTLGLHKISNPDPKEYAVSLHLYTPPNAALEGCNVFNAETGESKHVKLYNYYSEHGRKNEG
ncbi:MAG: hypothetical protein Q9200_003243 [Gallowayella weberi]